MLSKYIKRQASSIRQSNIWKPTTENEACIGRYGLNLALNTAGFLFLTEEKPREKYGFSSVVQFDHDMDIFSDDELVGLAIVAWNDMRIVYHQQPWNDTPYDREPGDLGGKPAVMTMLAQGKRLLRGSYQEGFHCVEWASTICDLTFAGLMNLFNPDRHPFEILRIVLEESQRGLPVEVAALIVQYHILIMAIMHIDLRPLQGIEFQMSAYKKEKNRNMMSRQIRSAHAENKVFGSMSSCESRS